MSSIHGMLEDQAIMGWGTPNPEISPGVYNFNGIAERLNIITSTGGTPVLTLCGAPDWMKGGTAGTTNWSQINVAPLTSHYQDFANLAAKIAATFTQVKYFVVWNELKGFYVQGSGWNIQGYTQMYNDVYTAIKAVRPDAVVGGPYAPLPALANKPAGTLSSTPQGPWGYVSQGTLDAVSYWLANKVGADFVAVDGKDFPESGPITDPLTATEKYAAVDQWLQAHTDLPIWWVESHIEPPNSGWTDQQGAAVRVAALLEMASSGASVGMQWQPQDEVNWPDEGLWTSCLLSNGGLPTALAGDLPNVLPVLAQSVSLVGGMPFGVIMATGTGGTIVANTTAAPVTLLTSILGTLTLDQGEVLVSAPVLASTSTSSTTTTGPTTTTTTTEPVTTTTTLAPAPTTTTTVAVTTTTTAPLAGSTKTKKTPPGKKH
jgi:hypothetical protein